MALGHAANLAVLAALHPGRPADEDAYKICAAIQARSDEIPWEPAFTGIDQLGRDTEATPLDVPLHTGAARWYDEHRGAPLVGAVQRVNTGDWSRREPKRS